MRKNLILALCALAALPAWSQQSEVVVKTAEVVQISNGTQSPNLVRVGTVTIFYCNNVMFCGPSSAQSDLNTYTYAANVLPTWLGSQLPATSISPNLYLPLTGLKLTSWNPSDGNGHALNDPTVPVYGLGSLPGSQTGFTAVTDATRTALLIGTSLERLSGSSNNLGFGVTTTEINFAKPSLGSNPLAPLHCTEPEGALLSKCNMMVFGSAEPGLSGHALYTDDNSPLLFHQQRSLLGLLTSTSETITDRGDIAQPIWSSLATREQQTLGVTGIAPYRGQILTSANYGLDNAPLNFGTTSVFGSYGSSTGTDADALSQQLSILQQSGARVVGWSILYDKTSDKETR